MAWPGGAGAPSPAGPGRHRAPDDPAAEHHVAVVEHHGLARGHGALRFGEPDIDVTVGTAETAASEAKAGPAGVGGCSPARITSRLSNCCGANGRDLMP